MLQNNCHQLRLHSLILNQMMLALCLINHCIRMSLKQESVLVSPYYCWLLRKIELQIFITSTQLYCHVICIYLASKKTVSIFISSAVFLVSLVCLELLFREQLFSTPLIYRPFVLPKIFIFYFELRTCGSTCLRMGCRSRGVRKSCLFAYVVESTIKKMKKRFPYPITFW